VNSKEPAKRKSVGAQGDAGASGKEGIPHPGSTRAEVLRGHEHWLHAVITSAPIVVFVLDRDGRFTLAEGKGLEKLGHKPGELVGRSVFEVYPNLPDIREKFRGALAGEMTSSTDRLGEHVFESHFFPLSDDDGKLSGLIGVATEVRDHTRLEESLGVERTMLRMVLQGLHVALWTTDRDLRLTSIEGDVPIFLNTAGEANLGRNLYELLRTEDPNSPIIAVHVQGLGGKSGRVESAVRDREYRIHVLPLQDDQGQIVGCAGMAIDVTERGNALEEVRRLATDLEQRVLERTAQVVTQKDELERANEQLGRAVAELIEARKRAEEASSAKSIFLTHITHELRTPLLSVIGFVDVLMKNREESLNDQDVLYLGKILANAKHLLSVINQMLDLSKIESGRMDLTISPVLLPQLVRETVEELHSLRRTGVVGLLADVPAQTAPLQADEQKLKQVLINLLGNALKFTERGSVVIRVATDEQHCPIRIEVTDTGIGIPRNKLEDIFEAFERAGVEEAGDYEGTGLGLTISRSLCRMMGYDLTVESDLGKGSTFSILLNSKDAGKEARALTEPEK
jgi:PAS domain S-box-containing protein